MTTTGDYKYIQRAKHLKNQWFEEASLGFQGLQMARTISPWTDHLKMRRALSLAVDRKQLAEVVMGGRVVPTSVYGPPTDSILQGPELIAQDLDSAHRLVAEAGYPTQGPLQDRPLIVLFAPPQNDPRGWSPALQVLQSMWRSIGVNVQIREFEEAFLNQYMWGTWKEGGRFEQAGLTWFTGLPLWPDATMNLRLADHTWYHQSHPLVLKKHLAYLNRQAAQFARSQKGNQLRDWDELWKLRAHWLEERNQHLARERDSLMRLELVQPDFNLALDHLFERWKVASDTVLQRQIWLQSRQLLHEAEIKYTLWAQSPEHREGMRQLAHLRSVDPESSRVWVQALQKRALELSWIIPLYSEKIVTLQKPWLRGTSVNRHGAILMPWQFARWSIDTLARQQEEP